MFPLATAVAREPKETAADKNMFLTWLVLVVFLTDGQNVQEVLEQIQALSGNVTHLEDGANTVTDKVTSGYHNILMRLFK